MTDTKLSPQKTLKIHRPKKLPGEYLAELNQIMCKERYFPQLAIYNHHITFYFLVEVYTSLSHLQQAPLFRKRNKIFKLDNA